MANYSSVPINFKEANDYADLEGVKQDLLWVVEASKKYKEINILRDFITREAFTFALIIKYARANISGKRRWIPRKWIEELSADEQKDHYYFMALRNKYVAHSVNDYEENYSKVYIKNIASKNPEFNQISVLHTRVVSIGAGDAKKLCELSNKLIKKIEFVMEAEKAKVEEITKKIPMKELVKYKYSKQFSSGKNNPFNDRVRKIIKS